MQPDKKYKYKGIAIFGAPGSGKTTAARTLVAAFPGAKHLEASRYVIFPAISVRDRLPADEKTFIRAIAGARPARARVSRDQARDFFVYLKNRYTPAVIAKTLIAIHRKRFPKRFVIIAGIRGYRNSVHFKKNGYLVIYLKTPDKHAISRLAKRENFSVRKAERESAIEERLFSTNMVEKVAHISFSTPAGKEMVAKVWALTSAQDCKRCVNTSANLSNAFGASGLCDVCEQYRKHFDRNVLAKELKFVLSLRGTGRGKHDALVGISGGKDSTATLYKVKEVGFAPLAFSLDTGYYPKHIFPRAKAIARELGVPYARIDIRRYMRPADRASFRKTAELYDERESEELKEKFRKWYTEGRRHYSVKCAHRIPFVRTCQLCRRLTIRAYYDQALRHGVSAVILGINEWAGLSQDSESKKFVFSAVRRLKPFKNKPAVYIVHLPFLLQRRIKDTGKILKKLGWKVPRGERLVESNANSCLFARAAESKARRMLGFHPDTTRLAREVTVGFISKSQARAALNKAHDSRHSVRQVLKSARII